MPNRGGGLKTRMPSRRLPSPSRCECVDGAFPGVLVMYSLGEPTRASPERHDDRSSLAPIARGLRLTASAAQEVPTTLSRDATDARASMASSRLLAGKIDGCAGLLTRLWNLPPFASRASRIGAPHRAPKAVRLGGVGPHRYRTPLSLAEWRGTDLVAFSRSRR